MRNNTKNKKPNNKGKVPKDGTREEKNQFFNDDKTGRKSSEYGGNDISWYTKYKDMVSSAAKLAFPFVPGRKLEIDTPSYAQGELPSTMPDRSNWHYPGFMAFEYYPTVGYSEDISSPINISARELYARVRKSYSGELAADAPDIMMYVLAVDSLYMLIEDMKRAYYLINAYTPTNNLFPKAIIQGLGYDFEDLTKNKMLFEQYIIEAIAIASKFKVPGNMDLIKRHQFMSANLYYDSPSAKAQIYGFRLGGVYQVTESLPTTETPGSTSLAISRRPDQFLTVEEARSWFMDCVNALTEWDTSYTILGYLSRAYDTTAFVVPAPLLVNGVLAPVYNEDILLQIQNLVVCDVDWESLSVTQDVLNSNTLMCRPGVYISGTSGVINDAVPDEVFVTIPGDTQPTDDQIIYGTRLTVVAREHQDEEPEYIYVDCGTEVITKWEMFIDVNGSPVNLDYASSYVVIGKDTTEDKQLALSTIQWLFNAGYIEAFDRHPTLAAWIKTPINPSVSTVTFCPMIATENVSTVKSDFLANLHRLCVYSEFNSFELL